MTFLLLTMAMTPPVATVAAQVDNGAVRVRILRNNGELVEELSARSKKGGYQPVLLSPTHPSVSPEGSQAKPNLLRQGSDGLFDAPPTFRFTDVSRSGKVLRLTSKAGDWTVVKTIELPAKGNTLTVTLDATTPSPYPNIRYLLNTYAFAPGKPDETWTPGLRPNEGEVIGDHFFRSPAAVIRKGSLAATVMPDLDVLKENRPIPTILDLDVANGVVKSPLISYGFADHKLVGHVRYAADASMVRPVPWELKLRSEIRLDADAAQGSAVSAAASHLWERYGHGYFDKILPQTMSFARYAELCYPAAMNEKLTGGWFERTIDGHVCGGIPSGWGLTEGWVSWQCWFNQLRSAWGLRWWGKRLNHPEWVDKANKMLNLALAAPMDRGATPTTYRSKTNDWLGSLVSPSPECYYDVPSIAWKGIWLVRWLKLPDCPRREDVQRQVNAIASLMMRVQRSDGSFPSWLTKDQKVVPILDRSAQSGLPAWFLAEYLIAKADQLKGRIDAWNKRANEPYTEAERRVLVKELETLQVEVKEVDPVAACQQRGARFVAGQVVPQRRYYDFETFFSCSPKVCLQKGGTLDDLRMWDPHTLQPPQNTLSMQWCAEAIRLGVVMNDFRDRVVYLAKVAKSEVQGAPKASKETKLTTQDALNALDTMNMYQNVWPISYRPVAYTFGGFGVQNSDGEYNDARQAQFGATLCDFGAKLGRRDLFERGVAAIRGSLTLVNIPDDPYQVYPDPNYPPGLEPENCGHGGTNEQNGRTGFDWGEGSGLAGAAEILDRYGDSYQVQGWKVQIDATPPSVESPEKPVNPVFSFKEPRLTGWKVDATFLNWPTRSARRDFGTGGLPFIGTCEDGRGGFDDAYVGEMTSPPFYLTEPTIRLLVGGGSVKGVGVELIDSKGKTLAIARGSDDEKMHEVVWTVPAPYLPLRIRIFDRDKGPWGHINVGNIRCQ